jgi:isoquinoline 1-oxidoreductase subunit beta
MSAKSSADANLHLSRRGFVMGAGLSVCFLSACSLLPPIPKRPDPKTADALGWISLTQEGKWRLYSPRMEMGQNILAGLRDIAAAELGIDASEIDVRIPSTVDIARVKATVGSDSIRELAMPIAQACYALRLALMQRAREKLNTLSVDSLTILGSDVVADNGNRVSLKALATPSLHLDPPEIARERLRCFAHRGSYKGSSFPQQQAILRGEVLFAADIRWPEMLYGLILRSPWPDRGFGKSELLQWNEAAVRAIPGFHSVVKHSLLSGPAILATRMAALESIRRSAEAKWETAAFEQPDPMQLIDVDTTIKNNQFSKSKGSVNPLTEDTKHQSIDIRLDVPLASHASIEPRCAVARPSADGGLEVWTGTQDPFYVRDVIQRDTGLMLEKIKVHPMRMGGAFGGKTIATVEREASILALLLKRPVKVQWSRADEFQAGFHRQPSSHRIQAQIDRDGLISDWRHSLSTAHVLFTNAILPPWLQALTDLIGDDGAARGQQPVYAFRRQRLDLKLTRLPVLTGPWRGLGAGPNVLAIEIAMDAAARIMGSDPLEFRLKHLSGASFDRSAGDAKRLAQCLNSVAQLAQSKPVSLKGRARDVHVADTGLKIITAQGLACGAYKGASYAAAVAEIAVGVNPAGQAKFIQLTKLWCSHDCGQVINPQAVEAQVQGNLVWSIGMILKERLDARQGTPEQLNFAQYSIPKMTDVPPMEIQLMASDAAPTGAGETAIVAGAGAIANALVRAFISAGLAVPSALPVAV